MTAIICFGFYINELQWKAATSSIKRASIAVNACISNAIAADHAVLQHVAQLIPEMSKAKLSAKLEEWRSQSSFFELIVTFDDGTYFFASDGNTAEGLAIVQKMKFAEADNMSNAFYGRNGEKQAAYRVPSTIDGTKKGTVYGLIELSRYYNPGVMDFYDSNGFAYVVNAVTGEYLIHTTRTMSQGAHKLFYSSLRETEGTEKIAELQKIMLSHKSGSMIVDMLGVKTYMYLMPLQISKTRYVISMIPYAALTKESSSITYVIIIFIVFIFICAVVFVSMNNAINKNKISEQEYRETLFGMLAKSIDIVFIIYDNKSAKIEYLSENLNRLLGIQNEKFSKASFEAFAAQFSVDTVSQIHEGMQSRKNFGVDFPYVRPDNGSSLQLRLNGYAPDESLWQDKWVFCIHDRTEDILRERQLEQAVHAADAANEAKSIFLASMSHDIRTPMNAILGMTQLALMDGTDMDDMRDYMQRIDNAAKFLLGLINDILDMSAIENGKVTLCPVPYPLQQLRTYLDGMIVPLCQQKELQLNITMDDSCVIMIDKERFHQIVFNLLSNAVKYTPSQGTVSLSIRQIPHGEKGVRLVVQVRDNGIGMTEEFQKEMFHLFTQERRRAQGLNGTGLGLAIVKRLVALMNGTIQVQSRLNEGSVFTVEFACEQAQMADISKASVRLPQRTDHPLRALLCEDNTVNQLIMKRLLKSIGVDCDVADNGVDGLTMFQQSQPGWYDIILMDLRMPQMNGYEATKKIRTLLRADAANIPIVALTADAFEDDKKRCLHIGMNDFIAKPVQLSILKEKLFINISGWREKC